MLEKTHFLSSSLLRVVKIAQLQRDWNQEIKVTQVIKHGFCQLLAINEKLLFSYVQGLLYILE
jgi:hypothetical protein